MPPQLWISAMHLNKKTKQKSRHADLFQWLPRRMQKIQACLCTLVTAGAIVI